MQNLIPTTIFIGLLVGSFLNCVIYRLSKNEQFLFGDSYCPYCRHILTWKDLIPVLSFLILKGKCRYCQKPISLQYPLVEISTALLFLLIFNFFTIPSFASQNLGGQDFQFLNFLYYLIISCFLIIIFVYDLKHYIIPDKIIYPATLIVIFYRLFEIWSLGYWDLFRNWELEIRNLQPLLDPLISAILAGLFFLAIVLVSRGRWMGIGDIKLAFLMGLFLGFPNILVALFFAFFIGAIIGMGLILAGKKNLKSEIPFGPFLVSGTFIALFWGQDLINWYLNILTT